MAINLPEAKEFFNRPGDRIAREFAARWRYHIDPTDIFPGTKEPAILAATTPADTRVLLAIKQITLYSDEETKHRFRGKKRPTRAEVIEGLDPAGMVFYSDRGNILSFIKTQNAANIMLDRLQLVNPLGVPYDDKELNTRQIGELLGIHHEDLGHLESVSLPRSRGFYLARGMEPLTPEQIADIEANLRKDFPGF